jgi:hypothetical protein
MGEVPLDNHWRCLVSRESLCVSQGQTKQRQRPDPRPNFKTQGHQCTILALIKLDSPKTLLALD